jgi:hypothetical protein
MVVEGKSITTFVDSLTRRTAHLPAIFFVALVLLLLTALVPACSNWTGFGFDPRGPEMQRIREVLRLKEGMTIADIGAGKGQLSSALASEVGPGGRIFATDVDRGRVEAFFLGRGEFGVPATVGIDEGTRSGFELLRRIDDWPGRGPLGSYCVLFRRPL